MRRVAPWLPEALLIALGIALRVTMLTRYDPARGYDFMSHWKFIQWMTAHTDLPHAGFSRETYYPPLYYAVIGLLRRHGLPDGRVALLSVIAGCVRLVLFEVGFVIALRRRRLGRIAALAIAAVLPVSIHLDGMIYPEAWLNLFAAALLVCVWLAFLRDGRARLGWCVAAGLFASLALLTKISVLAVIGAVGVAALAELALRAGDWRTRLVRVAPFVATLAIVLASTGWYFARNQRLYGKPFLTGYDYGDAHAMRAVANVPVWKRRAPGYVFGWTADIYRRPMWPAGYEPTPRFFPLVVATTFIDYYRYGFAPERPWNDEQPGRPHHTVWDLALLSVAAGTWIAALTVAGALALLVDAWRRRRAGELAMALAPLFAVGGQLAFAWKYPIDWEGPVKGLYLQLVALPLCACFGFVVDWTWRRGRAWRLIAVASFVAVACVAAYSIYGRFASPLVAR